MIQTTTYGDLPWSRSVSSPLLISPLYCHNLCYDDSLHNSHGSNWALWEFLRSKWESNHQDWKSSSWWRNWLLDYSKDGVRSYREVIHKWIQRRSWEEQTVVPLIVDQFGNFLQMIKRSWPSTLPHPQVDRCSDRWVSDTNIRYYWVSRHIFIIFSHDK